METKCKCESDSDSEAKGSCKGMPLDEEIKIPDKLHSDTSAAAGGLTFHRYFILKY